MIDERENLKNDLEEVLNSYVGTLGVHSILGELYPLLKHTEFRYSLVLRDFYLTKEKADDPSDTKSSRPFCWLEEKYDSETNAKWLEIRHYEEEGFIPVYTHRLRELTDEEIWEVISHFSFKDVSGDLIKFARAIIKASRGGE
jgi:hypothetical protein